jgi:hypothetical protein
MPCEVLSEVSQGFCISTCTRTCTAELPEFQIAGRGDFSATGLALGRDYLLKRLVVPEGHEVGISGAIEVGSTFPKRLPQ